MTILVKRLEGRTRRVSTLTGTRSRSSQQGEPPPSSTTTTRNNATQTATSLRCAFCTKIVWKSLKVRHSRTFVFPFPSLPASHPPPQPQHENFFLADSRVRALAAAWARKDHTLSDSLLSNKDLFGLAEVLKALTLLDSSRRIRCSCL